MIGDDDKSKVIIRTGIGSIRPLHPQDQHVGDFTESIRLMCKLLKLRDYPSLKKYLKPTNMHMNGMMGNRQF